MMGYAIGSFFGMMAISTAYAFVYMKIGKSLSLKTTQAWTHRPARFIILLIFAVQLITCLIMHALSWYMLYQGATFEPYTSDYGYTYSGEYYISTAWMLFGASMATCIIADILKGIFVLTFAD